MHVDAPGMRTSWKRGRRMGGLRAMRAMASVRWRMGAFQGASRVGDDFGLRLRYARKSRAHGVLVKKLKSVPAFEEDGCLTKP